MIQESVREMNAEERAELQSAMRPRSPGVWHSDAQREARVLGVIWVVLVAGLALMGANPGALLGLVVLGLFVVVRPLVKDAAEKARRREFFENYDAHRTRETTRVLQDGRVKVRRVQASAVVEIEPLEDEGTGYVFDVGDGRVLFIKDAFLPADDETPWPNTDFEIVRAAADGRLLAVHCHGTALRPLRVVRRGDVHPEKGWDEREEVLRMSVDEAVRSVLRTP
jgi:hypothetical protein